MKSKLKLIVLVMCSLLLLTGCPGGGKKETASNVKAKITITEKKGANLLPGLMPGEDKGNEPVSDTVENVTVGMMIYSGYGTTVTVEKLTAEEIQLKFDGVGFLERTPDGSINLKAKSVKKLTLKRGEQKEIMTEKMDPTSSLTFKYEAE
ncbi:MAG: hypothetical protein J6T47_05690 [Lachnospiraceae bacterium]|nr:hypothetical protein [Lachnospiraceae bacterium]